VWGPDPADWYVLDLDALSAWVADTRECVAMLLRPGTAPPSDVTDHKAVLASAFRQLPLPLWSKPLVRIGRRGLQPRPARSSPTAVHAPAPDALGDRLGRQRHGRAGHRAAAREGVDGALRQDGKVHEIKGPAATWFLARSPS
jgi:hypothetical protein